MDQTSRIPVRRRFFLGAVALLSLALGSGELPAAAPRPNIILAMADDMGWGDPSYYSSTVTYADGTAHPDQGWISTPTMDTMAASGLRFDRFYAASAVCSPTRGSCLTGRNPFRLGIPYANEGRLEFDEAALSKVLAAQGYATGHFGKWHLGTLTTLRADANRAQPGDSTFYSGPWHHGYSDCFVTESKVPTYHPYRKATNGLSLPVDFNDPNFYGTRYWRMPASWNQSSGEGVVVPVGEVNNPTDGDDSKLLVDQAIPFMQQAVAEGRPFFLVLWFHTPHRPMVDPNGVAGKDTPTALRGSIEDFDTALGRVRAELDALEVRDNTMFWVTSDNGPEGGDDSPNETDTNRSIRSGRFLGRKRSLHEGGVRVPGILEWPAVISTPRITDVPAVTSDYYTTILDLLQLAVPGQKPLDGISLRPVIEGTATTRTKPIGFKIRDDNSWVAERYKLHNDGSGWELFDMDVVAPGEEPEQTPIATQSNIESQPQAIQEIYNAMLAEFTAWDTSVSSDSSYIHSSQPTVVVSAAETEVSGPFTVTATFSEPVDHLHAGEFAVTNAAASDLDGAGTTWTVTITPLIAGEVMVHLPEGAAIDPDGNPNGSSNSLLASYLAPAAGVPDIETSLVPSAAQTVDFADGVPGDGSNNIDKFSGTELYVRGSSSADVNERRVRACVKFDTTALVGLPVRSATLRVEGFSLNSSNSVALQVVPLAADWAESGSPPPVYDAPTAGAAVNGGDLTAGLVGGTRDYEFDLTAVLRGWIDGSMPNHGLQIRLSDHTVNNGCGILETGAEGIRLEVAEAPLVAYGLLNGPADEDTTIIWNSAPGELYRVEVNDDLVGPWQLVAEVPGAPGSVTSHPHVGGRDGFPARFYRVAHGE